LSRLQKAEAYNDGLKRISQKKHPQDNSTGEGVDKGAHILLAESSQGITWLIEKGNTK
jgi:hypothetical protein